MKFGQFTSYCKKIEKFCKKCDLKTSSRSFCVYRVKAQVLTEIENFETTWSYWTCNSKAMEIFQNQHADFLSFLYIEDSLKIKKDLELDSRPHFSWKFSIRFFLLIHYKTDQISLPDCVYFPICSITCICFIVRHLMTCNLGF